MGISQDFIINQSEVRVTWTCDQHLKWKQFEELSILPVKVCTNSRKLVSGPISNVGHSLGVQRVG